MSIAAHPGRLLIACLLFALPLIGQEADSGKAKVAGSQEKSGKKTEKSPREKREARIEGNDFSNDGHLRSGLRNRRHFRNHSRE